HDLGKLLAQWQAWVEAYQRAKEPGYLHERALAHTDYDGTSGDDRSLSQRITDATKPRGPHAAPGAFIAQMLLPAVLQPQSPQACHLLICAIGAIVGHHGWWLGSEDKPELGVDSLW